MKKHLSYNTRRITAIILLFIVSINALLAGYSFIKDPSGTDIGILTNYIRQSAPFKDFLVPGIVLFVVNGIFSSVIAMLAIVRQRVYQLLILMQGCILVGWIGIQLMMVTVAHPLHLIIASIGLVLMVLGWSLYRDERSIKNVFRI